eukprot:3416541-Amphidinium_carterae.1
MVNAHRLAKRNFKVARLTEPLGRRGPSAKAFSSERTACCRLCIVLRYPPAESPPHQGITGRGKTTMGQRQAALTYTTDGGMT